MAGTHVALLRGINLAGKHRVPMKELAAMFEEAGCGAVTTYRKSGNVVFEAGAALARRVPGVVRKAISKRYGFEVPVVVRTGAELLDVTRHNPFLRVGKDPSTLHVVFLADRPSEAAVSSLDPDRSPPDEFAVRGREVYVHAPNGVGRTKITNAWLDAKLSTTSTMRNWRTVLELLARCR